MRADVVGVGVRHEPVRLPPAHVEPQPRPRQKQSVVPVKHVLCLPLLGGDALCPSVAKAAHRCWSVSVQIYRTATPSPSVTVILKQLRQLCVTNRRHALTSRYADRLQLPSSPATCRHDRHGHDLRRNLSAVFRGGRSPSRCSTGASGCATCRFRGGRRTVRAVRAYRKVAGGDRPLPKFSGPQAVAQMLKAGVDFVCVATPDDRHFDAAKTMLAAGKHVLIEKPSVLSLAELDELVAARPARSSVLAKVVYHKLLDPDHKKLRTLVADGVLQHVNNGYCSLLEPKSISGGQFAEWITGRNPGTYVAVHYIKLIDFTFGGRAEERSPRTGQRGLVGPADGPTWDIDADCGWCTSTPTAARRRSTFTPSG